MALRSQTPHCEKFSDPFLSKAGKTLADVKSGLFSYIHPIESAQGGRRGGDRVPGKGHVGFDRLESGIAEIVRPIVVILKMQLPSSP